MRTCGAYDVPLLRLQVVKLGEAKNVTSLYLSHIRRIHNTTARLPVSHEVSHVKEPMGVDVPGRDPLWTDPACGKGSQVHRPDRTPSDTGDSAPGTG